MKGRTRAAVEDRKPTSAPRIKRRVLPWRLARKTFVKWYQDPTGRFGAALSYYTAFAVVPLLVLVIAAGDLLVGGQQAHGVVIRDLAALVGQQSADALSGMVSQWREAGSTSVALGVAILTLLFAASGVFGQLQDALNTIWGVASRPRRPSPVTVMKRFVSILAVVGTAFLCLASLTLTTGFRLLAEAIAARMPGPEFLAQAVAHVVSLAGVTAVFAMIFKVVPDAKVAWSDVWVGAGVTAILFTAGKGFIILYLGQSAIGAWYGGTASLVVILVWASYLSHIVLLGAEFTVLYASEYGSRVQSCADGAASDERAKENEAGSRHPHRAADH